jgi:hypothetical protein
MTETESQTLAEKMAAALKGDSPITGMIERVRIYYDAGIPYWELPRLERLDADAEAVSFELSRRMGDA